MARTSPRQCNTVARAVPVLTGELMDGQWIECRAHRRVQWQIAPHADGGLSGAACPPADAAADQSLSISTFLRAFNLQGSFEVAKTYVVIDLNC